MPLLLRLSAAVLTLFLAAFTGGGFYLSSGKVLAERHEPYIPTQPLNWASAGFEDYIAWSVDLLRQARVDGSGADVIGNSAPFRLEPDASCPRGPDGRFAKGVLLTHGLIDSPYSMRPLGEDLRERCFLVYGLLLPGHGTRPGDLRDSGWEDWSRAQHFATARLAEEAETVVLAGHSAGGTLAILEASGNPAVDGLLLFAPALGISESAKYAYLADWFGLLFPGAAWHGVREDRAVYRYESLTYHSAAETWDLIQATWAALRERPLDIPVLTVASREDSTVSVDAIIEFMQAQRHPGSRGLLYSQDGTARQAAASVPGSQRQDVSGQPAASQVLASTGDLPAAGDSTGDLAAAADSNSHPLPPARELPATVRVLPSRDEARGILSLSHLGLMTPPDHPHYGRDGAYRYCGHYEAEPARLEACRQGQRDFYGEGTAANRERGVVERIAFNPWYDELLLELEAFLADLP